MTGHTGFKGAWLCHWLKTMGANTIGYSLEPESDPALCELLPQDFPQVIADISDHSALRSCFETYKPDIVFHMAAQALVRKSYDEPVRTYQDNIMGTVHVLEAVRQTPSVKAAIIITSDKVYQNKEWVYPYRENDPLGGHDPYSASKACCDLVTQSYIQSFFCGDDAPYVATVRAGNVIGGGDWAADRLIPDAVRAYTQKTSLEIRSPNAIRPWQYVLEPLAGYMCLAQAAILARDTVTRYHSWNFGPYAQSTQSVEYIVERLAQHWDGFQCDINQNPDNVHEASLLKLDITQTLNTLAWRPIWDLNTTLAKTADWYQNWLDGHDAKALVEQHISDYMRDMHQQEDMDTKEQKASING